MIGAVVGDIVGSVYEWHNVKSKDFDLFDKDHGKYECFFTDDTVMSIAITKAIMECENGYAFLADRATYYMRKYARKYTHRGYGGHFKEWIYSDIPKPYNSYGNGSAMRVSACGWAAESMEQVKILSEKVTAVTHNHPEGIKGAEAVAVAVYMALHGSSKDEIKKEMSKYYKFDLTLDKIRPDYHFDVSCQGTVPPALEAFFEAEDFEDAIRNAISIGGDSDTVAAITGSVAEAYFGVPDDIRQKAESFLSIGLIKDLHDFEDRFGKK